MAFLAAAARRILCAASGLSVGRYRKPAMAFTSSRCTSAACPFGPAAYASVLPSGASVQTLMLTPGSVVGMIRSAARDGRAAAEFHITVAFFAEAGDVGGTDCVHKMIFTTKDTKGKHRTALPLCP